MPNHPVAGAIIVVSVAVAAAIAVYESPQARQFAEDVRRRIAIALHSLGDEINPQSQEPRFNRPEDAEGFLQSAAEAGVDADEEFRRRQREELMYWNAVHMEKLEKERKMAEDRPANRSRGSSFDDFLQQDHTAEKGTYVYNTGAEVHAESDEGLRNRGAGVRGLNRGSIYANPFGDEHHIDFEEQRAIDASLMAPEVSERYETMSDLYSASDVPVPHTRETTATIAEQLIDTSEPVDDLPVSTPSAEMIEESYNFANMSQRDESAYASIHAWADNATSSFYSPLPSTPRAGSPLPQHEVVPGSPTFSDPAISVPGDLTPTMSLAGSGEEIWAPRSGATSEADMMSVDGDDIITPGSWTEVGSEVSENDVSAIHS
ncbi:hypothetical protein HYALB_00005913 [Hymenoscyphus albidus]|uniref:Uncharacterized protein n=1 Tax=Hymenoscyphus albidus TaxID=595503 RepID=A0A9N9LRV8_9HELO|nr:hypothetical protein HYALB_00005913 [Hymenoscyphus albidus]